MQRGEGLDDVVMRDVRHVRFDARERRGHPPVLQGRCLDRYLTGRRVKDERARTVALGKGNAGGDRRVAAERHLDRGAEIPNIERPRIARLRVTRP